MSGANVQWGRGLKIIPYLGVIMRWYEPDQWSPAPEDWSDLDVAYRENRVHPSCLICGEPTSFSRVIEVDGDPFWVDLCGDHMDPDRLLGLGN